VSANFGAYFGRAAWTFLSRPIQEKNCESRPRAGFQSERGPDAGSFPLNNGNLELNPICIGQTRCLDRVWTGVWSVLLKTVSDTPTALDLRIRRGFDHDKLAINYT